MMGAANINDLMANILAGWAEQQGGDPKKEQAPAKKADQGAQKPIYVPGMGTTPKAEKPMYVPGMPWLSPLGNTVARAVDPSTIQAKEAAQRRFDFTTPFTADKFLDPSGGFGAGTSKEGVSPSAFYDAARQSGKIPEMKLNIGDTMAAKYGEKDVATLMEWLKYVDNAAFYNLNKGVMAGPLSRPVGGGDPAKNPIGEFNIERKEDYERRTLPFGNQPGNTSPVEAQFSTGSLLSMLRKQDYPWTAKDIEYPLDWIAHSTDKERWTGLSPAQASEQMVQDNNENAFLASTALGHEVTSHPLSVNYTPEYGMSFVNALEQAANERAKTMAGWQGWDQPGSSLNEPMRYLLGLKHPLEPGQRSTELIAQALNIAQHPNVGHPKQIMVREYEKAHGAGSFEKLTPAQREAEYEKGFSSFGKKAAKNSATMPAHQIMLLDLLLNTQNGKQMMKRLYKEIAANKAATSASEQMA